MPSELRNLASLVDEFERRHSDIAIIVWRGVRQHQVRYGSLAGLCHRFAAELVQRGVRKGDRVLIWGENGPEWVAAFFGCVLRGVLPVPLDSAGTLEFVKRVEREVSPALIAGDKEKLLPLGPDPRIVFLDRFDQTITTATGPAIEDLQETDPLQIVFTSGTTGEPKGVVHTHGNVLASLRPIELEIRKYLKYERFVHPIRILHSLPLSHVFGQFMGLWIPPLMGAEVHYEPRLVAAEIVQRIHKERISVLAAVPRVLDLIERYLLERFPDLQQRLEAATRMKAWQRWWHFRKIHRMFGLKFWAFVCGGASLPPATEQFWNRLGFVVVQGYGMTETTALVSLNHPFRAAPGTIGQVLPGREVRLSDEGEVLVRGATISNASWEGGQLQRRDSDWLATGDLAELDQNGNLRFRGRKKDVIVTSSGMNIYPDDLEAVLDQQPGIKASAVVESDAPLGPEPLAVLVINPNADPVAAVASANRHLSEFQQVRKWIVWPEPDLPRTSTGKVLRREIARRVRNGEIGASGSELSHSELNLDSLGRVELQARLEQQYGISLDDAAIQKVKTQEDIRELVREAPTAQRDSEEHLYPHWPWNPMMQALRSVFLERIAMPLVRLLAKPSVRSEVRHWPSSPVLIVGNHVTSYDAALILYALPRRLRRRVAIAMSGEMILNWRRARDQGHWFLNLVAPPEYLLVTALFNIFPLPQLSGFRRSFRHAGEAMDRGYSVMVFPEGRRSDNETPLPFKAGTGLLWKELGVPALPVRLEGLGAIKAEHARWFRSGRISVIVRDILPLDTKLSPEELTESLRRGIFNH